MAQDDSKADKTGRGKRRPLVIRKTRLITKSHRSGAWKIAYADFVTALMAFFLLMWLVGTNSEARLRGIGEYFSTPLQIALSGGKDYSIQSSIVNGGSNTPFEGIAQTKKGETRSAHQGDFAGARKEFQEMHALKRQLEEAVAAHAELRQFKDQLLIDITSDGLRIQIVDRQNRPMFDIGSANLKPYTLSILRLIGNTLNEVSNKIALSGHTDASRYQGGTENYTNWELSLDRANAARRALVDGGMGENKIVRVVGLASSVLFRPDAPYSPDNRRISIIVMNAKAARSASMDGDSFDEE